jgi:hypothetical protein
MGNSTFQCGTHTRHTNTNYHPYTGTLHDMDPDEDIKDLSEQIVKRQKVFDRLIKWVWQWLTYMVPPINPNPLVLYYVGFAGYVKNSMSLCRV